VVLVLGLVLLVLEVLPEDAPLHKSFATLLCQRSGDQRDKTGDLQQIRRGTTLVNEALSGNYTKVTFVMARTMCLMLLGALDFSFDARHHIRFHKQIEVVMYKFYSTATVIRNIYIVCRFQTE
jgi:hypothetical protein